MNIEIEGIVLNSLPYKERDKILTLFSKERGILKLFVKGKNLSNQGLIEPFTIGEYLVEQGRGDLLQYKEGRLLDQNLQLRESWEKLEMSEKMSQAIILSQWPGKEAPSLYFLFIQFLKKNEPRLLAPFLIKVLKHEGVMKIIPQCSVCGERGEYRYGGDLFCKAHAPGEALFFTEEEEAVLVEFSEIKNFDLLLQIVQPEGFMKKIEMLFLQEFDH